MSTSTMVEIWVGIPVRDLKLTEAYIGEYEEGYNEETFNVETFACNHLIDEMSLCFDGEEIEDRIFGIRIQHAEWEMELDLEKLGTLAEDAIVKLGHSIVNTHDIRIYNIVSRM